MIMEKVCVITGATSGIGRATAIALGKKGFDLVLVGRRRSAGENLATRIRAKKGSGHIDFFVADLSVQEQVRRLASQIKDRYKKIDILINNAGARFDGYAASEDDIERTFATNYLSHFLLTCLLLEPLVGAPAARVISLGSATHSAVSPGSEWCLGPGKYDRGTAYGKSKLANVMFAYELARRLKNTNVASNAVDPGLVVTRFARNNGLLSWVKHIAYHTFTRELILPRKGAETVVFLAASEFVEGVTGKYFYKNREVASSAASYDQEAACKLWKLSVDMTLLNEDIGEKWELVKP
jgi:retinol dehydrogenase 14